MGLKNCPGFCNVSYLALWCNTAGLLLVPALYGRSVGMRRIGMLVVLIFALTLLLLTACGGPGGQDSAEGEKKGDKATADTAAENPLVGTWRRVRKCEEQVRLMKEAGLAELIPNGCLLPSSVMPPPLKAVRLLGTLVGE
jgi:hypothetical protein